MEILSLINELQELIDSGRSMPMSSSVLVDKGRSLDILNKMRINVPSAIKEGERMILERDRIIAEARSHAEGILQEAQERARQIVSEDEVVAQAQSMADSIIEQARHEAATMRTDAEQYQLNVLRDLGNSLHKVLNEVELGVTELEGRASDSY